GAAGVSVTWVGMSCLHGCEAAIMLSAPMEREWRIRQRVVGFRQCKRELGNYGKLGLAWWRGLPTMGCALLSSASPSRCSVCLAPSSTSRGTTSVSYQVRVAGRVPRVGL